MNRFRACRLLSGAQLLTALILLIADAPAHAQGDLHRAVAPSGRALVFVYRVDREPVAAQVPVVVNREPVGNLAHGTFVMATVDPGRTELRIGQRLVKTLTFVATPGQSYFVRVEAQTAVRIEAQPVSESDGRRALAQSRFVGTATALVIPPVVPAPVAAPPPAIAPPVAPAAVAAPPPAAPPIAAAPAAAPPVTAPAVEIPPVAAPAPEPIVAQPAAAPAAAAAIEPTRDWNIAVIAKSGSFKMADEDQIVAGLNSTYDTSSHSVFGIEAEWRGSSGFAVGVEFFTYKNDLVTTGANPNAQQKVNTVMLNGKYYFHAADWFYPYVGAGAGAANTSYSGGLTGNTTSFAYQGLVGVEFRFKPVGIYVQYKHLDSKWVTGDTGSEVKVGGSGILGGVSFSF